LLEESAALDNALARGVAIVSVMWVNNEVGRCSRCAGWRIRCCEAGVLFHSDAVQGVRQGSGVAPRRQLYAPHHLRPQDRRPQGHRRADVRDRKAVEAIIHGGGQQFGIRPGTENVPGIIGLGTAARLAQPSSSRSRPACASCATSWSAAAGDRPRRPDQRWQGERAPHITNVSIPGTDSEALLMHLDLAGVACSSVRRAARAPSSRRTCSRRWAVPRELGVAALPVLVRQG